MAEKKALVVLAPATHLAPSGEGLAKLLKKGALFTSFIPGDLDEIPSLGRTAARLSPGDVAAAMEKGNDISIIDMHEADAAALDSALAVILEAVDRKTVVAVAAGDGLALYGSGINSKAGSIDRKCHARDIIPTLAYIADFPIVSSCTGAILYQALKSPNLKLEEIGKLKEAIARMEGVMARDNREPWDKHDCA
jgi:hypothetical protein